MKPLDQFKRTPPRRYDKAPPPPPGDKRTFEPAICKRYFDMPTFDHRHIDRWLVQRQRADGRRAERAGAFQPVGGHPERKDGAAASRRYARAGQRAGRGGQLQPGSGKAGSEAGSQAGDDPRAGRNPAGDGADADHGGHIHRLQALRAGSAPL